MGMVTLPTFRWFQSRPKTAWCCRWVLGSVAASLGLLTVVSVFGAWNLGDSIRFYMFEGRVVIWREPFIADGTSFWQSLGLRDRHVPIYPLSQESPFDLTWSERIESVFPFPDVYMSPSRWGGPARHALVFPIWPVLVLTAVPALAAWRNRWIVKREVGKCENCGYSRTGLGETAPCPECGTAPAAPIAKT